MPSQSESDRQQCLAAAKAAGIPQAAIDAFIRENGWEDICRINSALAPTDPTLGGQHVLFAVPGLTSYSPAPGAGVLAPGLPMPIGVTAPALPPPIALVQPPGSSAAPLSTINAGGASGTRPSVPATYTGTAFVGPPATLPDDTASISSWALTAGPGTVTAAPVPRGAPAAGAPAPAMLAAGVNQKTVLLVAAAVVAYWLLNR